MTIEEFLQRVEGHPRLRLLYRDGSICIIRCVDNGKERDVRLGLWAVRERHWEQLVQALGVPPDVAVA